jgi:hypothetical protein
MSSEFSIKTPTELDRRLMQRAASPLELSRNLARNRREFLRTAAGVALGSTIFPVSSYASGSAGPKGKKVVVVTLAEGHGIRKRLRPRGRKIFRT